MIKYLHKIRCLTLTAFMLLVFNNLFAQVTVTNKGTRIVIASGNVYIKGAYVNKDTTTIRGEIANGGVIYIDSTFTNNSAGNVFITEYGTVEFYGNKSSQAINGTNSTYFNRININRTSIDSAVKLKADIRVSSYVKLSNGDVNLNGKTMTLYRDTAKLLNETATSRVLGTTGKIKYTKVLTSPTYALPLGNLGVYINAPAANYDSVIIERSHTPQTGCADGSILRYYNLIPKNSYNADNIKLSYFNPSDLNGTTATSHAIWKSNNSGTSWTNMNGTSTPPAVESATIMLDNMRLTIANKNCASVPTVALGTDKTICVGDTITLDAGNAALIHSWSTGVSTQTIKVASSGTYIATVTTSNGCVGKDTVVVNVVPKPTANFSFVEKCLGIATTYTSTSTGTINTYTWNFGDASAGSGASTSHTYASVGAYNVKLRVDGPSGCADSIIKVVNSNPYPVANFSTANVCIGIPASFTDASTLSTGSYTLRWTFGDGAVDSLTTNPSHNYASANTYNVQLKTTSNKGCANTITKPLIIYPKGVPSFTFNNNACLGTATSFTNNSTIASGTQTYDWNFGDAATSVAANPVHTYGAYGAYNVKLLSTSDNNCKDSITQVVNVRPIPVAGFTTNNACIGKTVSFTDTSAIATGTYTRLWKFGDGTTSTTTNPTKVYASAGSYNITLVVSSAYGCIDSVVRAITIYPAPVSAFSSANSCVGQTTVFTNGSSVSSGTLTYNWTFGEGSFSTNTNPTFTYPGAANYNVQLIAISNNGCRDSVTHTVSILPVPVANFSAANVCFGNTASFINSSTVQSGALIYQWSLGDGNTSTAANPINNYAADGIYNIKLVASSGAGCSDSITKQITVFPKPDAVFTTGDACLGVTTSFNNTSTISSGTLTYFWNFGDVTTSTLASPAHTYNGANAYNVSMVTTSNKGCKDTATAIVNIFAKPIAGFNFVQNCGIDSVYFTNTSSISTGAMNYTWYFGDGTTSAVANPHKNYATYGSFTVKLVVSSGAGCSDSITKTVNFFPAVNAAFTSANSCIGLTTQFSNTSTIASGTLTYNWSFGDGGVSSLTNPTRNYTVAGTYLVRLIATAANGCKDTAFQTIVITPKPTANFVVAANNCEGAPVTLNNTSTISSGALSYTWYFGDATMSSQQLPVKIYAAPGTYNVKLVATSGTGCSDSITRSVIVNPKPVADYTFSSVCFGTTTSFTNASAISSGIMTYSWTFGDGAVSTQINPVRSYTSANTFNAIMIATSNKGCKDTVSYGVPVYPVPDADFTSVQVCGNDTVHFTNTSVIASGTNTYSWNFGDATSSAMIHPDKVYAAFAAYSVKLISTSNFGCKDSVIRSVINKDKPVADFTFNTACLGNATNFTNASSVNGAALSYSWNFGNGQTATSSNPIENYTTANTYNVLLIASASTGCSDSITKTVVVDPVPVVNLGGSISTCGTTWTYDAQNPGATYLWSTSETTQTITATANGTYSVTVTNPQGCSLSQSSVLALNANVIPDLGNDTIVCGNILLDAGYAGSTYSWSTSELSQTINVTASGTYMVEVTDPNGCTGNDTINVIINNLPVVNLGADVNVCGNTPVTLDAANTGSAYLWSNNSNNQTFTPLTSGTYFVAVTDGNNCVNRDTVIVTYSTPPVNNLPNDTVICGSILLDAGNAGGIYTWNTGASTRTITAAASGQYIVTVTMPNTCVTTDTINVTIQAVPVVDLGNDTAICNNIGFVLNAGNAGSTYAWSDASVNQILSPNASGIYTVEVTTPQGCVNADTISLIINSAPVVDLGNDTIVCNNINLVANTSGIYLWSTGSATSSITASSTDLYWLEVTNGFSCVDRDSIQVTVNPLPTVNLGINQNICAGTNTVLDAGNPGASYIWNNSLTTQTVTVDTASTYVVTVTDVNNCSNTGSVVVNVNALPVVALGNDVTACNMVAIDGTVSGGITYSWSNSVNTAAQQIVAGGTYILTVTDGNGCANSDTIGVIINPNPVVALGTDITACSNVSTTLNAGNSGATYLWNTGAATQTINAALSGSYFVKVTDVNSCFSSDTINVNLLASPLADLGNDTTVCGSITLNATNTSAVYNWNTGANTSIITATTSGSYFVNVTATNGCFANDTIAVVIMGNPVVSFNPASAGCSGDTLYLDAANTGATYAWNTGANTQTIGAVSSGFYSVNVTNAAGCSATANTVVTMNPKPVVNLGLDRISCGPAILDALNPGSTYLWNNNTTNQTLPINITGTYAVKVTNNFSCFNRDTVIITVNPATLVNLGNDTALCTGNTFTLNAGNAGASYSWNTGQNSQTHTVGSTGSYIVTVTAPNTCVGKDTIQVTFNNSPVVNLGPDRTVCVGAAIYLDAGANSTSYAWGSSVGLTGSNRYLSVSDSATYWVKAGNTFNCYTSDTVKIMRDANTLEARFISASQANVQDTIVFIQLSSPTPSIYFWNFGDGDTTNIPNPMHAYNYDAVFPVRMAVSRLNCSDTLVKNITILPLRKSAPKDSTVEYIEPEILSARAYPNPTSGQFRLEVKSTITTMIYVDLFDLQGRLIESFAINANALNHDFDISRFANAIYIVRVIAGEDVESLKIIKTE